MNRRELILTAAATLAVPSKALAVAGAEVPSLGQVGKSRGIEVGSRMIVQELNDARARRLYAHQCAQLTPDHALKPHAVSRGLGRFDFRAANQLISFAKRNDMVVHGHTLYWYQEQLKWVPQSVDVENPDAVSKLYWNYVKAIVSRYPEVSTWEVINEPIQDNGRVRTVFPFNVLGEEFIDLLLHATRKYSPNSKLIINDYWLDCRGKMCSPRRRGVLRLAERLLKRGAPLDGIGTQMHLNTYWGGKPSPRASLDLARSAKNLGLDLYITEMDVNDWDMPANIAQRDQRVAEYYFENLNKLSRTKALKRITFWGLPDKSSWIHYPNNEQAQVKGGTPRPALFDDNFEPKPAYWAVLEALKTA